MNVPDVANADVFIPGTPWLCCCTAKHRPVMSHTVSTVLLKLGTVSHNIPGILAQPARRGLVGMFGHGL